MAKGPSRFLTSLVAIVAALLVVAAGLLLDWWQIGASSTPELLSPASTPSPSVSVEPPPPFAPRPVTTATHVPSARPLSQEVLDSAGSGWVVAIHDSTSFDDAGVETPGPTILYLISPDGARYELANLDTLGLAEPDLVAWDYGRSKVLLVNALSQLTVFNMVSGAVDGEWTFCENTGYVRGSARDGAWLLRGACGGSGIDGLYTDAGAEIPSDTQGKEFGFTVFDIGDVQVAGEFETPPDERFTAFYPDGTSSTIPSSAAGDCYMIGKGRGATFVAYCYTGDGTLDVWEFPVDGSTPTHAITSAELEAFRLTIGVPGPGDFWVSGYCADSALRVVEVTWDQSRLGVLRGGTVEPVGAPPYAFRHCEAASGTAALVSGDGLLWYTDFGTGATVEMLPGPGDDYPLHVVGTDGYRALLEP